MFVLLGPLWAAVQPTEKGVNRTESETQDEIRQLEGRRLRAMMDADTAALDRILGDDLTYTHSNGAVDTKASFLAAIKSGKLKYESVTTDGQVRVQGDTAVVTGRGAMRVRAGDRQLDMAVRFTDVYVKRDGRWQMITWQSTRIVEP
jgi:ketosteroid isomerase-like protein